MCLLSPSQLKHIHIHMHVFVKCQAKHFLCILLIGTTSQDARIPRLLLVAFCLLFLDLTYSSPKLKKHLWGEIALLQASLYVQSNKIKLAWWRHMSLNISKNTRAYQQHLAALLSDITC